MHNLYTIIIGVRKEPLRSRYKVPTIPMVVIASLADDKKTTSTKFAGHFTSLHIRKKILCAPPYCTQL